MAEEKKEEQGNISPLSLIDLLAIELRFEGLSGKDIAGKIKEIYGQDVAPKTVSNWFVRAGRLRQEYIAYAKEQTANRQEIADHLFKANVERAVKGLINLAGTSDSDMVKLLALKEIINRQMGEPKKVIQTETIDPVDEILKKAGITPHYEQKREHRETN